MKYGLVAIDVDGTLVNPDQTVSPEVVDAIAEAEAAGIGVCLATGRSYAETMPVWRQLRLRGPYEPVVLIGGALVAEPDTGRTLYQRTMPRALACEFADALIEAGYSAMAIVDPWRHGVDYFFAESRDVEQAAGRWFDRMNVKVRRVGRLSEAPDMPNPLRVSAVVDPAVAPQLAQRLAQQFDGRLNVQSILAPNYGLTIVEAFVSSASKLAGVIYVAQARKLGPGQIAAVGDDINDLSMIRGVGLGVAMPQAPQSVRAAARHVAQGGLAKFIRDLAAGKFE